MLPEELKSRARRIVEEVLNQGDLAVADELISADCIHHLLGDQLQNGFGQLEYGFAFLNDWLTRTHRIFPDFHAIVEDEIAEGDRVAQRLTGHGTHKGEFFGVPPTGEQVTFDMVEILRAGPDGKFVERWSSVALVGVLHELGAISLAQQADQDSDRVRSAGDARCPVPVPDHHRPATRTDSMRNARRSARASD